RDRLTARLPMLAPPRRGGDNGAVRVEVRGCAADGSRVTHIAGAAGRVGEMAGAVAAAFALSCARGRIGDGVHVAGGDADLSAAVLCMVADAGIALHEFTGIARPSDW